MPDPRLAILAVIRLIPPGKVASYGQLADLAGLPGRARLVGRVLATADSRDLPWHRVVSASGAPGLPANSEAAREQCRRLREEGVAWRGKRVDMKKHQWRPDLAAMLMLMGG
ncbi:cysteine methyltransferase [Zobellella taiwanensis]|jgi:methylated-DNA-protein-cysteine methyltransferase-like protein|uniref:Cysteine methyltransferase n=1 Tax=Zobellella taiwanensis TaxID=347535 RepID=A0A2P7QHR8_9GAMM|nr:MGMT family protein [Zobellella taiwanensis]PSJ37503.1 cysteine methyltransferase [Zobellella taiwanensis]